MSLHRDHDCASWESFCVPSECLRFFENRIQKDANIEQKIKEVCKKLETLSLFVQERQKVSNEFVKAVKDGFGKLSNNDAENCFYNKMEKKIRTTVEVLQSRAQNLNVDNFEKIIDGDNNNVCQEQMSSLRELLKLLG